MARLLIARLAIAVREKSFVVNCPAESVTRAVKVNVPSGGEPTSKSPVVLSIVIDGGNVPESIV